MFTHESVNTFLLILLFVLLWRLHKRQDPGLAYTVFIRREDAESLVLGDGNSREVRFERPHDQHEGSWVQIQINTRDYCMWQQNQNSRDPFMLKRRGAFDKDMRSFAVESEG